MTQFMHLPLLAFIVLILAGILAIVKRNRQKVDVVCGIIFLVCSGWHLNDWMTVLFK
jgi:hypothetical protein